MRKSATQPARPIPSLPHLLPVRKHLLHIDRGPAQRHVVVPEVVRGQRGLDLLEDVVRAGGARRDLALFHAFLTGVGDSISGFYKVFYEAVI